MVSWDEVHQKVKGRDGGFMMRSQLPDRFIDKWMVVTIYFMGMLCVPLFFAVFLYGLVILGVFMLCLAPLGIIVTGWAMVKIIQEKWWVWWRCHGSY